MIKTTFKEGIDSPIDIAIYDKRMGNLQDSILGTISGNLCAGKIVGVIYPKIAYNLVDRDFSRALTLHQNFKEKKLMKEGNRPYSITYQISYALSNTHHSELFIINEFIEIPEIFGKVAQTIYPERIEFPLIPKINIQIQDKSILQRSQSLRLEVCIKDIPRKELDQLVLGLKFLEEHKPWKRLENGMEFLVEDRMWKIQ